MLRKLGLAQFLHLCEDLDRKVHGSLKDFPLGLGVFCSQYFGFCEVKQVQGSSKRQKGSSISANGRQNQYGFELGGNQGGKEVIRELAVFLANLFTRNYGLS